MSKIDINRPDLYEFGEPELNERTRKRLTEIAECGMEEVMTAEFGYKGVMSGLYIEHVWHYSDKDFKEYMDWAKGLIKEKTNLKPNELRAGNILLYHIGEEGEEWALNKLDWQDLKWCTEDNEGFNKVHLSVPITPETMKKALNYKEGNYTHARLRGYFVALHLDGKVYAEYYIGGYSVCKVEYMHQLQNLVFDLTNEELNF